MVDDLRCGEVTCTSRRGALAVAGGTVLTGVLTACGGGAPEQAGPGNENAGTPLADVGEIPVGGGTIFKDQSVVITQPEAGTITAFSAACTHQGCTVDNVSEGLINCVCHGSQFDISDGSVVTGPATDPLPEVAVNVNGDEITLA